MYVFGLEQILVIVFIFFFLYKIVKYDLLILLKKNIVYVYFMREIFEDEN